MESSVVCKMGCNIIWLRISAGSPVPSGPSTKDSDQDGETEAENAVSFTSATDVPQVGAEGDAPTGARPAPEGDENEPTITDDSQQERIIQQVPRTWSTPQEITWDKAEDLYKRGGCQP